MINLRRKVNMLTIEDRRLSTVETVLIAILFLAVAFISVAMVTDGSSASDGPDMIYGAEGPYTIYLRAGETYSYAPTVKEMTYPDGLTMEATIPSSISQTMHFTGNYEDGWLLSGKINTASESGYTVVLKATWVYTREGQTNPTIEEQTAYQTLIFKVYDNVAIDGHQSDFNQGAFLFSTAQAGDVVYAPVVTGPTGTSVSVTGATAPFVWNDSTKQIKLSRNLTTDDIGTYTVKVTASHDVQGTAIGQHSVVATVNITVSDALEISSDLEPYAFDDATVEIYQVETNFDGKTGITNLVRSVEDLPQSLPTGFVISNANGVLKFNPSKVQFASGEEIKTFTFTAKATGTYTGGTPAVASETVTLSIIKKLEFISTIEDAVITSNNLVAYASATVTNASKVTINWGDSKTTVYNVVGDRISGTHVYSSPGMYEIVMTTDGEAPATHRTSVMVYEEDTDYDTILHANNGTSATITKTNLTFAPECEFGYSEHIFVCWNTSADRSGTDYYVGSPMVASQVPHLYAIWQDSSVPLKKLTLDANGGTSQTVELNNPQQIPINTWFSKSGWHFTSWNTMADGSGTSYAPGASITLNDDLTLYAQWVQDTGDVPSDETNDYTWAKILCAVVLAISAVAFILTRNPMFAGISGVALIALIATVVML